MLSTFGASGMCSRYKIFPLSTYRPILAIYHSGAYQGSAVEFKFTQPIATGRNQATAIASGNPEHPVICNILYNKPVIRV